MSTFFKASKSPQSKKKLLKRLTTIFFQLKASTRINKLTSSARVDVHRSMFRTLVNTIR